MNFKSKTYQSGNDPLFPFPQQEYYPQCRTRITYCELQHNGLLW